MVDEEKEIWVGENRFYLGEDDILYETIVGVVDEKTALSMAEASIKLRTLAEGGK